MTLQLQSFAMARYPLTGSRVSLSASTRERGRIGKGQPPWSQANRAGHESPGEDCGRPHQTVGVNRRFPVWLRPRQTHNRRNLCCQAAAREVSSWQKRLCMAFLDLEKAFDWVPRKVIWWALRKLGVEDCTTGAGDVCKGPESCPCWWGVQWRVWSICQCSPRLSTQPASLHHCAWSLITRVQLWGPWVLYADDLVIITESLEECVRRLLTWKEAMEKKGLRVNAGKTKIIICCTGLDLLQNSSDRLSSAHKWKSRDKVGLKILKK